MSANLILWAECKGPEGLYRGLFEKLSHEAKTTTGIPIQAEGGASAEVGRCRPSPNSVRLEFYGVVVGLGVCNVGFRFSGFVEVIESGHLNAVPVLWKVSGLVFGSMNGVKGSTLLVLGR